MKIEENFEKIEKVIAELESPETGLERSFELYEQGMKLLKEAEDGISRVEEKLTVLSREREGNSDEI